MSVYISVALQQKVREKFHEACAYCHSLESLTLSIFEFEHIVPRSAGGQTMFENLCFACPTCNRYKATRQTGFDSITQQMVPLFHPHQQQWSDHFYWSINGTLIQGITPNGRATIARLKMNRPQLVHLRRLWVKVGEHPPMFDTRGTK